MPRPLLSLPLLLTGTPLWAQPYGHMGDWGYGVGMMFGPVIWLVVLGLVVAGVVWAVRRMDDSPARLPRSAAMAELDLRLARGEISVEEHATRKKALSA